MFWGTQSEYCKYLIYKIAILLKKKYQQDVYIKYFIPNGDATLISLEKIKLIISTQSHTKEFKYIQIIFTYIK